MPKPKDVESKDRFLSDILRNHIQNKIHFDTKANWLLAVSALILSFSLPHIKEGLSITNLGFVIIFLSSLLAFLFSLVIFEPPNFLLKLPHSPKSMMFYKSFKHMTPEDYAKNLKKVKTSDAIIDQYAHDVSNLVNRSIAIKNKLIKWPAYILFFGVLLGAILTLVV